MLHETLKQYGGWVILGYLFLDSFFGTYFARGGSRVRVGEEEANTRAGRVGPLQLSWHLTHTREDVSTILLFLGDVRRKLSLIVVLLFAIWAGI